MKILFISRAYPPVTGGIENQNYALSVWLKRFATVTTIANRHGKKVLPFFLPYATLRALFVASRYDAILLGDGVLAIAGTIIKCCYPKKPVAAVIHGLDLTYKNSLYQQWWVQRFLPSLDKLIVVSNETRSIALAKNIPEHKITVINNGVDKETLQGTYTREDLERLLHTPLIDKQVLLTTGRLAKRKGAAWFIRNVLPHLPKTVLYVLAGSGPDEQNIRDAIRETGTESQMKLLGRVSDEERNLLLNTADIFVQPNIHVPGDIEGFGIAVIEAAACKRPVVASNMEGLKDAVCHNENGILVDPRPEAFKTALLPLIENAGMRQALGERASRYTEAHFHWNIIARLYVEVLNSLIKK